MAHIPWGKANHSSRIALSNDSVFNDIKYVFFIEERIAVDDVEVSRTKRGFGKSGPPCNSKFLQRFYLLFQTTPGE